MRKEYTYIQPGRGFGLQKILSTLIHPYSSLYFILFYSYILLIHPYAVSLYYNIITIILIYFFFLTLPILISLLCSSRFKLNTFIKPFLCLTLLSASPYLSLSPLSPLFSYPFPLPTPAWPSYLPLYLLTERLYTKDAFYSQVGTSIVARFVLFVTHLYVTLLLCICFIRIKALSLIYMSMAKSIY